MLSVLAVSCQKEEVIEPVDVQIQQSVTIRNVTYKVDGATMHATIRGEQNWRDFVDWLFALAEEGHRVSFRNESIYNNQQHSKDTVVYTTKDKKAYITISSIVKTLLFIRPRTRKRQTLGQQKCQNWDMRFQ